MSDARNKSFRYERIPLDQIEKSIKVFHGLFRSFLRLKNFSENTGFHISFYSLVDAIVRVDKRKAYYRYFHGMEINECKEAALYAYWILKLKPFTITDKAYVKNVDACTINESFAIFMIALVLENTGRIRRTPSSSKESYKRLLDYSFRFRDFSMDSLVVLVESIGTDTLEREYPDLHAQP